MAEHCSLDRTSSARASSAGGSSSPSAFAVFRVIMNSNFEDCMTGRRKVGRAFQHTKQLYSPASSVILPGLVLAEVDYFQRERTSAWARRSALRVASVAIVDRAFAHPTSGCRAGQIIGWVERSETHPSHQGA